MALEQLNKQKGIGVGTVEAPNPVEDGEFTVEYSDLAGRRQMNQELALAGEDLVHHKMDIHQGASDNQQGAWEAMGSAAAEGAGGVVYSKGAAGRLKMARATNANVAVRYLQVHNDDTLGGGEVPYMGLTVEIPVDGVASLEGLIPECGLYLDVDVTVTISSTLATYTAVNADEHLVGVLFG